MLKYGKHKRVKQPVHNMSCTSSYLVRTTEVMTVATNWSFCFTLSLKMNAVCFLIYICRFLLSKKMIVYISGVCFSKGPMSRRNLVQSKWGNIYTHRVFFLFFSIAKHLSLKRYYPSYFSFITAITTTPI